MAKDAPPGVIGISVRDTNLRMAEALRTNGEHRITRITQGRVRTPFDFSSFKDAELVHRYAEDLNRLYETSNFQAQRAVFALDSNMVLIKKIPVDASLKGQRLKDHIYWEVEQFVINPLEEYVIDFEHVPPAGDQEYAEAIVVVVRRVMIEFLKAMFRNTDMRLGAIDVDVFAAHRVMTANYEFPSEVYTALIDLRKENLQFAIIRSADFYLTQDVDYPLEEQIALQSPDELYLPRILSKELRRIILDNKLGRSVEEMEQIIIYGENVTEQIVDALRSTHNVRVERANPFRKIKVVEGSGDPGVQKNPEVFVIPVGAALKAV